MTEQPDRADSSMNTFTIAAAGLMMLIVALLAGLWLRTRSLMAQQERELAQLRPLAARQETDKALMGQLLQTIVVRRDELAREKVTLNGRSVQALLLPAAQAFPIGFEPGDMIIVEPREPATAPTGP